MQHIFDGKLQLTRNGGVNYLFKGCCWREQKKFGWEAKIWRDRKYIGMQSGTFMPVPNVDPGDQAAGHIRANLRLGIETVPSLDPVSKCFG